MTRNEAAALLDTIQELLGRGDITCRGTAELFVLINTLIDFETLGNPVNILQKEKET